MQLTGKQRRHLRSLGHSLPAVVQIGKSGLTDAIVRAVDAALEQHELIKVRLGSEAPDDRSEAAELLGDQTRSAVAQVLGRTILLYRRRSKDPKIVLPKS